MRTLAATIEKNLEGILSHWKEGLTTSFMEGLNSCLQRGEEQGTRLQKFSLHDYYALLRSRQARYTVYLYPLKVSRNPI